MTETDQQAGAFRLGVVTTALELFSAQGYESTTVEQIAAASGISRRTFFRQFRSKEDVVFADHDALIAGLEAGLARPHDDPWRAVTDGALSVFHHFQQQRALATLRYRVVAQVPALRERELVSGYRYERVFTEALRRTLPATDPARLVGFASAVTAVHNFVLRQMVRGEPTATADRLSAAFDELRFRFAQPEP